MPLPHVPQCPGHASGEAGRSVPDVPAGAEDARRGAGGEVRHPDRLERWAQDGDLFLRTLPPDLPLRGVQVAPAILSPVCSSSDNPTGDKIAGATCRATLAGAPAC